MPNTNLYITTISPVLKLEELVTNRVWTSRHWKLLKNGEIVSQSAEKLLLWTSFFFKTRAEPFVTSISTGEPVHFTHPTHPGWDNFFFLTWLNSCLWRIKCNEVALYPDQYDICSVQPSLHARTVSEDDPQKEREREKGGGEKILRRKAPIYQQSGFHATSCTDDGWREILAPILGAKWRNVSRWEKGEPRTRLTCRHTFPWPQPQTQSHLHLWPCGSLSETG